MDNRIGVLVMAYGTPASTDEILPYYTHIRRGRPPEPHQLAELTARYEAIGGLSPLSAITVRQAAGVQRALEQMDPARTYPVYIGMKHANPFIADTVSNMVADGLKRIVSVVLAPHYSTMSVEVYNQTAQEAVDSAEDVVLRSVREWYLEPDFIASTAARVQAALDHIDPAERAASPVLFTAHSLPQRILSAGDPYPDQIRDSAAAVAARIRHENWACGWQSAGRTPEPWLGPDLLVQLGSLAEQGTRAVVVCPIGFVSDHLEVLYDIDIEAQKLASELGIQLVRAASPNDEELCMHAIAKAVRREIGDWE